MANGSDDGRDATAPAASSTGPGGARRAERERQGRRRQQRRRSSVLVVAAVVAMVAILGVVLLVTRADDTKSASTARRAETSSSTPPSTTSTLPVATTAVPRSANPVVALAQQYDGRYVGRYTNTTFSTTGPASLQLRIDPVANNVAIDADFDGDFFGGGAQKSRRISGTVALGDPTAAITTQTPAFGPVTGQIDASLALVLTANDVPNPKVKGFQMTGRLRADNTGFDATYTVTFKDGKTARGTVALNCDPKGTRGSAVTTICALSHPG